VSAFALVAPGLLQVENPSTLLRAGSAPPDLPAYGFDRDLIVGVDADIGGDLERLARDGFG